MPDEAHDVVQPGSLVRYRDATGREEAVLIRSDDPERWSPHSISKNTTVARAFIGRRVGDQVEVEIHPLIPLRRFEIVDVA